MIVVAYTVTHSEGRTCGIITEPGEGYGDSELYEAGVSIQAFHTVEEARAWLDSEGFTDDDEDDDDQG